VAGLPISGDALPIATPGSDERFGVGAVAQFSQVTSDRLSKLAELVDQGALKVNIDRTFPLEQASTALLYLEKESPIGKVVLKIV
jgi:NADPH:quinone reductase-like Zn-dependent oxidoreductase